MNKNKIDRLINEGILKINDYESLPTYESCLLDKMIKSYFKRKDERASNIIGLVHSDICRPMNISTRGGYYHFIIFTNDLSRCGFIYLMKHKSESFEIFK